MKLNNGTILFTLQNTFAHFAKNGDGSHDPQ